MDKLIKLKITKLANDGEGLAIYNGKSCFLYNALPNEEVLAKVSINKRGAYIGEVKKILFKNKDRIELSKNPAELIGLTLAHYKYEQTLEYKNHKVSFHLRKVIPNFDQVINKIVKSPFELNYRNETEIPIDIKNNELIWGLYKPESNIIVPTKTHLQQNKVINNTVNQLLTLFNKYKLLPYNHYHRDGLLRKLKLRINPQGKLEVTIFKANKELPTDLINDIKNNIPEIIKLNSVSNSNLKEKEIIGSYKNLYGDKYFNVNLNNRDYYLSYDSFFQLNYEVTKLMYEQILNSINDNEVILDAYAGVASIGIYLNKKAKKIYSIEINKKAVDAAKYAILKNNLVNIEIVSNNFLTWFRKTNINFDTVIFDPPRGGLGEEIITLLNEKRINKVIYISCNIESLAKDLKKLKANYTVLSITPYDMFPHTAHIETVVVLSKLDINKQKSPKVKRD